MQASHRNYWEILGKASFILAGLLFLDLLVLGNVDVGIALFNLMLYGQALCGFVLFCMEIYRRRKQPKLEKKDFYHDFFHGKQRQEKPLVKDADGQVRVFDE